MTMFGPLPWLGLSALLALGLTWSCQRTGNLNQEIGGLERDLAQAVTAAKSNETAIEDLIEANEMWTRLAAEEAERSAVAVRNLTAARAELESAAERVRIEREVIFREPECAELAMLDVAKICPPLAESMRDRAVRP